MLRILEPPQWVLRDENSLLQGIPNSLPLPLWAWNPPESKQLKVKRGSCIRGREEALFQAPALLTKVTDLGASTSPPQISKGGLSPPSPGRPLPQFKPSKPGTRPRRQLASPLLPPGPAGTGCQALAQNTLVTAHVHGPNLQPRCRGSWGPSWPQLTISTFPHFRFRRP